MAASDDPPFLSVGTEVSAKYRGAFCEATVKVAKKQVKCKVAYRSGQTVVVSNDVVKGPLKVGAAMEVRQQDGQYLPASILKLTDNSIYTVVFDDGDERTLKRSSLCLKGGRHFHESESLDKMPLTDPENFGTPVLMQSMKRVGRRKRRPSQSSVEEDALQSSPIKQLTYPSHLPVGKCVFLENDRRRSSWFPAVVVPPHYVQIDGSDPSDDTVCIRSFKDGRFYAAKASNLHDFSPSKEPLMSMLEGDVQSIYMCKPAIERAMAYLDTGELPWDMQLSENKREGSNTNDEEEDRLSDEQKVAAAKFYEELKRFQEDRGAAVTQNPSLGQRDIDLYKLYRLVRDNGGMEKVSQEFKWRSLYLQLGMPPLANSSYMIKQVYRKYLYSFEAHERAREEGRPQPRNTRRRVVTHESDEDMEDKQAKTSTKTGELEITTSSNKSLDSSDIEADIFSSNEDSEESKGPENQKERGGEGGVSLSAASETPVSTTSVAEDRDESVVTNGEEEFCVNDRVNIWYGRGKTLRTYAAKILEKDNTTGHYFVHYNGWNTRYDEWVEKERLASKIVSPAKGITRPCYKKKPTLRRSKGKSPNLPGSSPSGQKSASNDRQQESPSLATTPSSSSEDNPFTNKSRRSSAPFDCKLNINKCVPAGKVTKRKRCSSSMTESGIGDSAGSPVNLQKMASPFSDPPSYPTSSERHSPLPSPALRVPPILSPDGSHDSYPMRVQPESTSSSNPSSEADQVILVKKEENASWQPIDSEFPIPEAMDTSPTSPDRINPEITSDGPAPDTTPPTPPTVDTETPPKPTLTPILTPSINLTKKRPVFSPPPEDKMEDMSAYSSAAVAAANLLMAAASSSAVETTPEPTVRPSTCEEDSSSSSSPSMESEREQTPPVAEEKPLERKGRRSSSGESCTEETSSGGEGPEAKKSRRNDLDFTIDLSKLQELDHMERVTFLQERMKAIQKKYMELKTEVTYLERKKRKARRREREAAKAQNVLQHQHQQPSPSQTPLTVQCL